MPLAVRCVSDTPIIPFARPAVMANFPFSPVGLKHPKATVLSRAPGFAFTKATGGHQQMATQVGQVPKNHQEVEALMLPTPRGLKAALPRCGTWSPGESEPGAGGVPKNGTVNRRQGLAAQGTQAGEPSLTKRRALARSKPETGCRWMGHTWHA